MIIIATFSVAKSIATLPVHVCSCVLVVCSSVCKGALFFSNAIAFPQPLLASRLLYFSYDISVCMGHKKTQIKFTMVRGKDKQAGKGQAGSKVQVFKCYVSNPLKLWNICRQVSHTMEGCSLVPGSSYHAVNGKGSTAREEGLGTRLGRMHAESRLHRLRNQQFQNMHGSHEWRIFDSKRHCDSWTCRPWFEAIKLHSVKINVR